MCAWIFFCMKIPEKFGYFVRKAAKVEAKKSKPMVSLDIMYLEYYHKMFISDDYPFFFTYEAIKKIFKILNNLMGNKKSTNTLTLKLAHINFSFARHFFHNERIRMEICEFQSHLLSRIYYYLFVAAKWRIVTRPAFHIITRCRCHMPDSAMIYFLHFFSLSFYFATPPVRKSIVTA